jgi:ABC-type transport system involved in multi-copper enzyme maturation permease subunit
VVLLFAEVVVVAAIAVFFSSWTSPFLSGAFTLGMFVLGRSVPDLIAVTHKLKAGALSDGLRAMTRVLPDFHLFYVSGSFLDGKYISVHGEYVTWSYVAQVSGYGLFYAALALLFASLLFNRRDFI